VGLELAANGINSISQRRVRSQIDEVDKDRTALDMAQKLDAETRSFVRSFDEAGDVRHHQGPKIVVGRADNTEMGFDGRKRVIGDLWPGR
jgi:hypothetical protein